MAKLENIMDGVCRLADNIKANGGAHGILSEAVSDAADIWRRAPKDEWPEEVCLHAMRQPSYPLTKVDD